MDGIFGIGLPEMMIIALVLFIIGGPENTRKWAREAGRMLRKLRRAWAQMMSEVERELGPDGKELMDATRELSRSAYEFKHITSPRALMSETTRFVDSALRDIDAPATPASATGDDLPSPGNTQYRAWLPPDED